MKKLVAIGLSAVMAVGVCGALAGCGGGNTLTIWSFTDEIDDIVEKFKEDVNPDYEIEVVKASTASHHSKLIQALRNGTAPDVFTVEYAYARNFLESGKLMSLSEDGFDFETRARLRPIVRRRLWAVSCSASAPWQTIPPISPRATIR